MGNNIVLTWPHGHWLTTSTNVEGPYQEVTFTSPYTNTITDPRRFFLIR